MPAIIIWDRASICLETSHDGLADVHGFGFHASFASRAAYAANEDLKAELARKQKELADLSAQIDAGSGPEFKVARDIEMKVTTDVVQDWAFRLLGRNGAEQAHATER